MTFKKGIDWWNKTIEGWCIWRRRSELFGNVDHFRDFKSWVVHNRRWNHFGRLCGHALESERKVAWNTSNKKSRSLFFHKNLWPKYWIKQTQPPSDFRAHHGQTLIFVTCCLKRFILYGWALSQKCLIPQRPGSVSRERYLIRAASRVCEFVSITQS